MSGRWRAGEQRWRKVLLPPSWGARFLLPVRPERSEGFDQVMQSVCRIPFALSAAKGLMKLCGSFATFPLMPRGSHFSCFAKKSNQKKATPTIGPILRCSEKSGTEKNSLSLKQFSVLIAFFLRFSGPINGDPSQLYLIAMR